MAIPALLLSLLVAVAPSAAAKPSNPSNGSIDKAKQAKTQAARDVGRLSGLISGIEAKINRLNQQAELAKQKYDKALFDLGQSKVAAAKAQKNVKKAQTTLDSAQVQFTQFLRAVYMNSQTDGTGLLTAADPAALLSRGDLTAYASSHQINGIGSLTRATVAKSNADAAARVAVLRMQRASLAAGVAFKLAVNAVASAKSEQAALVAQKATFETQLRQAGVRLLRLNHQRNAYVTWKRQQEALARAAAARRAAAVRAALAGNGQHSSGGNPNPSGQAARSGSWTPARGRAAVSYAEHYLGWPYAWDGGSYYGPTVGQCMDAVTTYYGDCHKVGFDCSGLTMYAWAQLGIYTSHYAPSQWSMGRYHPSLSELMPGDLILLDSYNGSPSNAGHIVMYIGGGQIIEAPESGAFVHTTGLYLSGFAGVIRPGS